MLHRLQPRTHSNIGTIFIGGPLVLLLMLVLWVGNSPVGEASHGADETIERVSVHSGGNESDGQSFSPSISADGRYVAFNSWATNLVDGDTNGASDIFVHDRETGEMERVSVTSGGNEVASGGISASISADGRYVAFWSYASNLVEGDENGVPDVFVHDRDTGVTERVSVASDGTQGDGDSSSPSIIADGRYVAFRSAASNLVDGDGNAAWDIFVHDRETGVTELVSVDSDGNEGDSGSYSPGISADGRYVSFYSEATNLVEGDDNGMANVFVHDRDTGVTERVSVASDGNGSDGYSYNPSISADGRYVSFRSSATNLVEGDTNGEWDIFVHDRETGETTRVSVDSGGTEGDDYSYQASISADGHYVAFESSATNLVPGDENDKTDVFVTPNPLFSSPECLGLEATIVGTEGDDEIHGTHERDVIVGLGGNDVIHGHGGDDVICGGPGNDRLHGDDGNDRLDGGEGGDWLHGGWGHDDMMGGPGKDKLHGDDGNDHMDGGQGNDQVHGGRGHDDMMGGPGKDKLHGGDGNDRMDGGQGNDMLHGGRDHDDLFGGSGKDQLHGSNGDDFLDGGGGDDELHGGRDRDDLFGGPGVDQLHGGNGDDFLDGGNQNDQLHGGNGDDHLKGGDGDDVLHGGRGDDDLVGGLGVDQLHGGNGDDRLEGSDGDDELHGGRDRDDLFGGPGNDELHGGRGDDNLNGGPGADHLDCGPGLDHLNGTDPDDTIDENCGEVGGP